MPTASKPPSRSRLFEPTLINESGIAEAIPNSNRKETTLRMDSGFSRKGIRAPKVFDATFMIHPEDTLGGKNPREPSQEKTRLANQTKTYLKKTKKRRVNFIVLSWRIFKMNYLILEDFLNLYFMCVFGLSRSFSTWIPSLGSAALWRWSSRAAACWWPCRARRRRRSGRCGELEPLDWWGQARWKMKIWRLELRCRFLWILDFVEKIGFISFYF